MLVSQRLQLLAVPLLGASIASVFALFDTTTVAFLKLLAELLVDHVEVLAGVEALKPLHETIANTLLPDDVINTLIGIPCPFDARVLFEKVRSTDEANGLAAVKLLRTSDDPPASSKRPFDLNQLAGP